MWRRDVEAGRVGARPKPRTWKKASLMFAKIKSSFSPRADWKRRPLAWSSRVPGAFLPPRVGRMLTSRSRCTFPVRIGWSASWTTRSASRSSCLWRACRGRRRSRVSGVGMCGMCGMRRALRIRVLLVARLHALAQLLDQPEGVVQVGGHLGLECELADPVRGLVRVGLGLGLGLGRVRVSAGFGLRLGLRLGLGRGSEGSTGGLAAPRNKAERANPNPNPCRSPNPDPNQVG